MALEIFKCFFFIMKKVLITGSIAYDYIMNFDDSFKNHIIPDKIHVLSVSFVAKKLEKQFGGTAGNIAYNVSLLGEEPILFSTVGSDFTPYRSWLEKNNIELQYVEEIADELTASAHIITDQDDNQITAFHGGAMFHNEISINHIIEKEKPSFAVIAPNAKEGNMLYISELKNAGIPYILDPGQNIPLFEDNELKNAVDSTMMLIVNDYELSLVEKKTGYTKNDLIEKLEYLVVTLGAHGSEIYHNGKKHEIPAAKAKNTSDPTGAGDAYRAGIIKGLMHDMDIETMGKIASVAAVYTVEKYGTQTHSYSTEEFVQRYNENFNEKLIIT